MDTKPFTSKHVRRVVGAVAAGMLMAACGGSSDGAETDASVPSTEAVDVAVTEVATTVAPVVTEAPVEEPAAAVEVPSLPCAEYVAESGYPLKPCDSGVLVESLQRDLESLFPSIGIDGLFGQQTFGFIQEFQASNGLEETGVVSEDLAGAVATAESLGDAAESDESAEPDESPEPDDAESGDDGEAEASAVEATGALDEATCTALIGQADEPAFTADAIEACSDIGVDIVHGGDDG